MKNILLLVLFSLSGFVLISNTEKPNGTSIELVYTGDQSKPFPVVVFYLPGTINTTYDSTLVHKVEITDQAFRNIKKNIMGTKKFPEDSILASPYEFRIVINGEVNVVSILNLKKINKIFQTIINEFKSFGKRKKVTELLNSIKSRLRYEVVSK